MSIAVAPSTGTTVSQLNADSGGWRLGAPARTIIRAKAPLRISFGGGGTDLPHWYEKHGGAVFSATINRYAYVTLYPRDDGAIRIRSVDMGYLVQYHVEGSPIYDGILDLAKAAIHRLGATRGMDIDVRSDAPAGSGLGGSSALTAAVIGAVANYTSQSLDRYDLAEMNFEIERHDLRIAGGKQDQYATTFGNFNLIEFAADRVLVNPLNLSRDLVNDLESHLLLCYTGRVRADLGLVSKQVQMCEQGRLESQEGLRRLYKLAFDMKAAVLRGRLGEFGEMLHEAYVNKKRMNPEVAAGTIADTLYEKALAHGATGGKLLGAGGGGYLLLYCETDKQHEVRQALQALGGQFTDFAFDGRGLQTWRSQSR
jgi:D-glycero-alpha-D-manno-heptose-7-phosphate kinase